MNYTDFQIRAWQVDEKQAQVIVHSSPVGDLRRPLTVPFDAAQIRAGHMRSGGYIWAGDIQKYVELGRQLSNTLLPRPVYNLVVRSLDRIAPEDGLRVRLCLDESLMDFPWELMYRPDVEGADSRAGFVVLDPRISLAREAPTTLQKLRPTKQKLRMVFAGMTESDGSDPQQVRREYQELSEALRDVAGLLSTEFITAAGDNIELALMRTAAVFHFAGFAMEEEGRGFLVREIKGLGEALARLDIEALGSLLRRAQTKLVVLSANNSAKWNFVEPLIRAGIPAIVGMHAAISITSAVTFAQKLYASLAIGLSLDEAVSLARLKLLQEQKEHSFKCEWAQFAVYMPTAEAVLLPRPEDGETLARQDAAHQERQETIESVAESIGIAPGGEAHLNKEALRLALTRYFSLEDLNLLCADVEQALARDQITLPVNLDMIGGDSGLENKVLELLKYLERRGHLHYLVAAARAARPKIFD